MMNYRLHAVLLALCLASTEAFSPSTMTARTTRRHVDNNVVLFMDFFDAGDYTVQLANPETEKESPAEEMVVKKIVGPLELNWENVDAVLDEMRPYLIADGGNVIIKEITGTVVLLELQGECGTCPSSTQTMKMGLEKGLMETIPEITQVIQDNPKGPDIDAEQIAIVLDNIQPYLSVFDSSVNLHAIQNVDSLQPVIKLQIKGNAAGLKSTQQDIAQRLQKHFLLPGLRVEFIKS